MLKYKGHNIGGAGTLPSDRRKGNWKSQHKDRQMYLEQVQRDIQNIIDGNASQHYLIVIKQIDNGSKK